MGMHGNSISGIIGICVDNPCILLLVPSAPTSLKNAQKSFSDGLMNPKSNTTE